MHKLYALTDYKNHFGSKWKAKPYRAGYDQNLLQEYFKKYGWKIIFIQFKDIDFNDNWKKRIVIYTSSEEKGLHYKSFIEDIILGLERLGAIVIPSFEFLRANNNKIYMEILRNQLLGKKLSGISSKVYGSYEELTRDIKNNYITYPCVLKEAVGAMSKGVFLANNKRELVQTAKKISRTPHYLSEIKEIIRSKKHRGYQKESKYQNKFIVQNFVAGLKNDWKILVYGNHYYVLNRGIKEKDFRASGSHYDYRAGSESGITEKMLDSIKKIYFTLDVPHLSLDFAWDGSKNIVHEFQAIHFGTSTMDFSDDLFVFEDNRWKIIKAEFSEEEEYVYSLVQYLDRHL